MAKVPKTIAPDPLPFGFPAMLKKNGAAELALRAQTVLASSVLFCASRLFLGRDLVLDLRLGIRV